MPIRVAPCDINFFWRARDHGEITNLYRKLLKEVLLKDVPLCRENVFKISSRQSNCVLHFLAS